MGKAPVYIATSGQSTQLQSHASDGAFVAAKGSPAGASDHYFNSTSAVIRYHDGVAWRSLSASDIVETLTNKTLTTPQINGNRLAVAIKTANYTAALTDDVFLCDAGAGGFTITLPTAASAVKKTFEFKKTDSSVNLVTIDANGSETIDGLTTVVLGQRYDRVSLVSDGSYWHLMGAAPTVSARYRNTAGQANITNATDIITIYPTKDWDTHSAVTNAGSAWRFTAPMAGKYQVNATNFLGPSTLVQSTYYQLFKNGALFSRTYHYKNVTTSYTIYIRHVDVIELAATDYIEMKISQDSGATQSIAASTGHIFINVDRIGN